MSRDECQRYTKGQVGDGMEPTWKIMIRSSQSFADAMTAELLSHAPPPQNKAQQNKSPNFMVYWVNFPALPRFPSSKPQTLTWGFGLNDNTIWNAVHVVGCSFVLHEKVALGWHRINFNLLTRDTCQGHKYMMMSSNGNIFHVTGPLWGESTGQWWIPLTKASYRELWCFLWSVPKQTAEQTIEILVIWDTISLIMTSV